MVLEPVRLVVWDLDGVFWKGTISEGSVEYLDAHHEIVVELARRGIISSICSKNDLSVVKSLLEARGIWQYFAFPSIGWSPKGRRVAALIQAMQLRPESVVFIDDEPANLAEALYYVPGLQVVSPKFISDMLNDPKFAGKDDLNLTRLAQYKILQSRHDDSPAQGEDNHEFLHASNIEVTIGIAVEDSLDRAIELINRTNQLNFTKNRLPEDITGARKALRHSTGRLDALSGVVRVRDRYGDYGVVGFFCVYGHGKHAQLEHFCFSCRILNMGVERFFLSLAW